MACRQPQEMESSCQNSILFNSEIHKLLSQPRTSGPGRDLVRLAKGDARMAELGRDTCQRGRADGGRGRLGRGGCLGGRL